MEPTAPTPDDHQARVDAALAKADAKLAAKAEAQRMASGTCRPEACARMVSRNEQYRLCFIKQSLGWGLTDAELRAVPLGLLSKEQLRELRQQTTGERDVKQILLVLMVIAPKALTAHVTGKMVVRLCEQSNREDEETIEADLEDYLERREQPRGWRPPERPARKVMQFGEDWIEQEAEDLFNEAMWRDIRGQHPDGEL